MLGVVAEMAARVMGAKATSLRLLDEATGQLMLRATHNISATEQQFSSIAVGQSIAGLVAASGQPILVPNVQTDERYLNRALAEHEGWVSVLSVPLMVPIVRRLCPLYERPHEFTPKRSSCSRPTNQTRLPWNARLVINAAVVREMHHRVKNNLQTIAMLPACRRARPATCAQDVLPDDQPHLSIAAVHETLSEQGLRVVDEECGARDLLHWGTMLTADKAFDHRDRRPPRATIARSHVAIAGDQRARPERGGARVRRARQWTNSGTITGRTRRKRSDCRG
jgi:two-component sensor histidine kinase